jgi:hypothetical protein
MNKYITLSLCFALSFPLSVEAQGHGNGRSEASTTKIISDDNPILSGDELGKPVDHYINSEVHDFWHSDVFSESLYTVGQKLKPVAKTASSVLEPLRKAFDQKRQPLTNGQPASAARPGADLRQAIEPVMRSVQEPRQTTQR